MANERSSNRIEVDLKLLQDQNLAALRDFGSTFESTVDKLLKGFGSYVEQLEAAAQLLSGQRVQRVSPGASQAPGGTPESPISALARMRQRWGTWTGLGRAPTGPSEGASEPRIGATYGDWTRFGATPPAGNSSRAPVSEASPGSNPRFSRAFNNYSFAKPNLTEYEQAQFALGTVPTDSVEGVLRYLSHYTGLAGITGTGEDAQTRKILGGEFIGNQMQKVSAATGAVARGMTAGRNWYGTATQIVHAGAGAQSLYGGLGYDPRAGDGYLPPIFSAAGMHSLGQKWGAEKDSWFGLNPNLSTGDAEAIQQSIANQGFKGQLADQMRKTMEDLKQNTGWNDYGTMSTMLDKATRFGTESLTDFSKQIYAIRDAANSANIPMASLAASLDGAASSVSQSSGTSYATAVGALTAFTAATGLDPSRGVAAMELTPSSYFMAKAFNPNLPGVFDLQQSGHYGSAMMASVYGWAGKFAGAPVSEWPKLMAEGNSTPAGRAFKIAINSPLFLNNPMLKGMSATEIYTQSVKDGGNPLGVMHGTENIAIANKKISLYDQYGKDSSLLNLSPTSLIQGAGMTKIEKTALFKQLHHDFSTKQGSSSDPTKGYFGNILTEKGREAAFAHAFGGETLAQADKKGLTDKQKKWMEKNDKAMMADVSKALTGKSNMTQNKKNQVEVTLSPLAHRLLRIMEGDKSQANSQGGSAPFASEATHHKGTNWTNVAETAAADVATGGTYSAGKALYDLL